MATALGLHVGRRIREAREAAGLRTQQALADVLPPPINNQYVSKWEKGVKPKEETLALIAAATGKEVAWFYEGFQRAGNNGDAPDLVGALSTDDSARLQRIETSLAAIQTGVDQLLATTLTPKDYEVIVSLLQQREPRRSGRRREIPPEAGGAAA